MRVQTAFIFIASMGYTTAQAGQIDLTSRVEAVTVYTDSALVQRIGEFSIPPGDSTLIFHGVSPKLVEESVRAKGFGGGVVAIGAVTVRRALPSVPQGEAAIKLAALNEEKQSIRDKIAATQLKKQSIETFVAKQRQDASLQPLDWPAIWLSIGADINEADNSLRALKSRSIVVDQEIKNLQEAAQSQALSSPGFDVGIEVTAAEPTNGKLELDYLVTNAKWAPVYDVRLDLTSLAAGRIAFVRRAEVAQRVGEEWNDVKLTLKTTAATAAIAASSLEPHSAYLYLRGNEASLPSRQPSPPDRVVLESEKFKTLYREMSASTLSGVFDTAYVVPGLVSLPANGVTKTYRLASFEAPAQAFIKTAPSKNVAAFIEANFVNPDAAPILGGIALIYRDGIFVGHAKLASVAPGGKVELGFGQDDKVVVEHYRLIDTSFTPQKKHGLARLEKVARFTIRNGHEAPVKIVMEAQVPVSSDDALSIVEIASPRPTERDVDKAHGVMNWAYDYKPGETRTIDFGYRAAWPVAKGELISDY